MTRRKVAWLLAAIVSVSASVVLAGRGGGNVVYGTGAAGARAVPRDRLVVDFSHVKHAARGVGCDFCHAAATKSRQASDLLLPSADVCATCHVAGKPGAAGPVDYAPAHPARQLRFDHAAHAQKEIACRRCHVSPAEIDLGRALPKMLDCQSCHDSQRAPMHAAGRCQTCHLAERDGTLQTQLPMGVLSPQSGPDVHTLSFRTEHGRVAGARSKACESCHRQDFCQSCHNGLVKPLDFHGNDYLTKHPVDARRADQKCATCHRAQSFCLSCHERSGVGGGLPGAAFQPGQGNPFHPPGFNNDHGTSARRNLRTCVSCHREDSCSECHSAMPGGKMQKSPHGSGWKTSVRCQSLAEKNPRVCLRCHDEARCGP